MSRPSRTILAILVLACVAPVACRRGEAERPAAELLSSRPVPPAMASIPRELLEQPGDDVVEDGGPSSGSPAGSSDPPTPVEGTKPPETVVEEPHARLARGLAALPPDSAPPAPLARMFECAGSNAISLAPMQQQALSLRLAAVQARWSLRESVAALAPLVAGEVRADLVEEMIREIAAAQPHLAPLVAATLPEPHRRIAIVALARQMAPLDAPGALALMGLIEPRLVREVELLGLMEDLSGTSSAAVEQLAQGIIEPLLSDFGEGLAAARRAAEGGNPGEILARLEAAWVRDWTTLMIAFHQWQRNPEQAQETPATIKELRLRDDLLAEMAVNRLTSAPRDSLTLAYRMRLGPLQRRLLRLVGSQLLLVDPGLAMTTLSSPPAVAPEPEELALMLQARCPELPAELADRFLSRAASRLPADLLLQTAERCCPALPEQVLAFAEATGMARTDALLRCRLCAAAAQIEMPTSDIADPIERNRAIACLAGRAESFDAARNIIAAVDSQPVREAATVELVRSFAGSGALDAEQRTQLLDASNSLASPLARGHSLLALAAHADGEQQARLAAELTLLLEGAEQRVVEELLPGLARLLCTRGETGAALRLAPRLSDETARSGLFQTAIEAAGSDDPGELERLALELPAGALRAEWCLLAAGHLSRSLGGL